jgi:hypothetical protein
MRTSPSVPGLGTNPCLGKHFRQRVTACEVRGPFFSRTHMTYERNADAPEPADVLEAGNYYRYYAGSFDGATENDAMIDSECAKLHHKDRHDIAVM